MALPVDLFSRPELFRTLETGITPRATISTNDYSPINNIITWILAIAMAFAVIVKVIMKSIYQHTVETDDIVLIIVLVRTNPAEIAVKLAKTASLDTR